MNNGYRWLSDDEVEISRDNNYVIEKVDGNINVEKLLLYQNLVEIYQNKMIESEKNMLKYVGICAINIRMLNFQLIAVALMGVLSLIFPGVAFYSLVFKISLGLAIYFGIQDLIFAYQIKQLQEEHKALEKLITTYEVGLERTKIQKKELSNSFYKSINYVSFSKYNDMFYELADKQVDATIKKDKVKKLTLKKKR